MASGGPCRVLILGGGPVGVVCVHVLNMAPKGAFEVKMIRSEPTLVNRCAVPYGIPGDRTLEEFLVPNEFVTNFGCELIIDTATSVDREKKIVATESGKTFPYDFLVLGLGSRPIMPPLPGLPAENVVTIRRTEDLAKMKQFTSSKRRVCVIGGGYIGLEIASVVAEMGLDVTVVEMLPHVLMMTTEEEFCVEVENSVCENHKNVRLMTGVAAKEFVKNDSTGLIEKVILANGEVVETDVVVMSVGIAPEVALAKAMGLEVSRFGVVVDEKMRTSDPSIFAGGDMVEKKSLITGKPTRGEFGTTAVLMSKIIGMNLLGMPGASFPGVINASASMAFGFSFGAAGLTEREAVANGMQVVVGRSEVWDKYPMMKGKQPIKTKLVFELPSMRLVGGSSLERGTQAAAHANLLSLAIAKNSSLMDLMNLQYSTHPELASRPSEEGVVVAAMDAWKKMMAMQAQGGH